VGFHARVPASYATREFVEAGGLMSYGTPVLDMFRQVGIYVGSRIAEPIRRAARPNDAIRVAIANSNVLSESIRDIMSLEWRWD
jgi:hypothetical protein